MYEAGTIVAGKYRIDQVLGSGGMGVVVAATHLQLGTPVALKFMHEQMTQNASVVERVETYLGTARTPSERWPGG